MSASGKPAWKTLFEPKVPGFPKVPLGDLGAVDAAIGEQTAAVMLEPIQGEAGVIPAGEGYPRGLRELTENSGVLLIDGESQAGMGRTGRRFDCCGRKSNRLKHRQQCATSMKQY